MRYVRLGDTGLKVSEICFGTWHLPRLKETDPSGVPKVDIEETRKAVELAFDHGINFVDTANRYHGAMGRSDLNHVGYAEKILGEILRGYQRESFVVSTKVGIQMAPWINGEGLSRKHVLWQLNESLKRLQLDYVDVYLAHCPDEDTPHLETLRVFNDLIRMGKVNYIGSSNFTAEQIADFMQLSAAHDLYGFVTLQESYSLINRTVESDKLPLARKHKLAIMVYSPLAEGLLSGKYMHGVPSGSRATYSANVKRVLSERKLDALNELSALAREKDVTLPQLAIAWITQKQKSLGVSMIPIVGVSSRQQLLENLQALDVKLSPEDMSKAEEIGSTVRVADLLG